jgi:hypothetical protein
MNHLHAAALALALATALLAGAAPAAAASFDIEASSDLRQHGLSWSGGHPTLVAHGSVEIGAGLTLDAGVAGLRGSARHGGARLLGEAALRYERQSGPWRWWGELQGLGFAGARGQDYAQLRAGTALGIGPAQVVVQADWAPPQAAIGGGNLHMRVLARTGVPGTPITLAAAIGRTTGNDDGSGQSRRLRPCGDYSDFLIDADHVRGALTLGATLTATTIDRGCGAADAGARLLFRASLGF